MAARSDVPATAAPVREIPDVPQVRRTSRQEVGVQRQDDVGILEVVEGVEVLAKLLAKRQPRALQRRVTSCRVVLIPFRLRKLLPERAVPLAVEQVSQRRRDDGLGQDAQPGASLAR